MVSRITQSEINSLPDFLTSGNFVLMLGAIPGSSTTKRLALQCKSAAIPGESIEALTQTIAGFDRQQAGRRTFSHSFSVTFAETKDMEVTRAIRTWMQNIRGTKSGVTVGYSEDYTTSADVYLFDTTGAMVKSCTIYKVFPTEFPEVALDGTGDGLVEVSVTFSYDYQTGSETTDL